MFDDLAAFFHENAVSAYVEYVDVQNDSTYGRSRDLRAAIDAASALYHFREHIPNRKSRAAITMLCPDYDLLGDVVNATKHRELIRGKPKIKSAEDLYEVTVITAYADEAGPYRDVRKVVRVKLLDGSERDLLEILTNVINFWGNELKSHGVVSDFRPFALPRIPGATLITREDARQELNIEVIRGVRFRSRLQLRQWNRETGNSEPVDLTDAKVNARIYMPSA